MPRYTFLKNSTGTDDQTVELPIEVPVGAKLGKTRMRVMKYYGVSTEYREPCVTRGSYGQTEDYSIVVGTLGVQDVNKTTIYATPNPVRDILTINTQKAIKSISVISTSGQQVIKNMALKENKLNMSSLAKGIYMIQVVLENGEKQAFKVIKN